MSYQYAGRVLLSRINRDINANDGHLAQSAGLDIRVGIDLDPS